MFGDDSNQISEFSDANQAKKKIKHIYLQI